MTHIATIAHLSDLHFVKKLTEAGQFYFKYDVVAKPHAFEKVEFLSQAFAKMRLESDEDADVTVITGDLTTNGSKEAFNTMLNFIGGAEIRRGKTQRVIAFGLEIPPNKRILIPGNHDRYTRGFWGRQASSSIFEETLTSDIRGKGYPNAVGYRRDNVKNVSSEPAIIFFNFDSTLETEVKSSYFNRFARGHVGKPEFKMFTRIVNEIKKRGYVESLSGDKLFVDYDRCVKIVAIHHDPFETRETHLLENADLLKATMQKCRIDLVLYGHTHIAKTHTLPINSTFRIVGTHSDHKTHYICSPSATECYGDRNGFFVYEIHDNLIRICEYDYRRKVGFLPKDDVLEADFTR